MSQITDTHVAMTDLEKLKAALIQVEAKGPESDHEWALGLHQRMKALLKASIAAMAAMDDEDDYLGLNRFLGFDDFESCMTSFESSRPGVHQLMLDYLKSLPGYDVASVGKQGDTAMENHGYVVMKLTAHIPRPATVQAILADDYRTIERFLDRGSDQSWRWRAKMLIDGILPACSVLDESELPKSIDDVCQIVEIERIAVAAQKKSPDAAVALWEYLEMLPDYSRSKVGSQRPLPQEMHNYVIMQLPSTHRVWVRPKP